MFEAIYIFHLNANTLELLTESYWLIGCWNKLFHVNFWLLSRCVYREAGDAGRRVFGQVHHQHAARSLAPFTCSWVLPASGTVRCSSLTNAGLGFANYPNHTHRPHRGGGASTGIHSCTYVFGVLGIGNELYICLNSSTNCVEFFLQSRSRLTEVEMESTRARHYRSELHGEAHAAKNVGRCSESLRSTSYILLWWTLQGLKDFKKVVGSLG